MAGKNTQDGATAPGAAAVEALASPLFARVVNAALTEAVDALRAVYAAPPAEGADPRVLTPTQKMTLDALSSLGDQLVTATTPVGGASS